MPKMKISAAQAGLELGFTQSHFAVMKQIQPNKFKYIYALDPSSLISAYKKYIEEQEQAKSFMTDAYYTLLDNRKLNDFCKFVCKKGVYNTAHGCSSAMGKALFSSKVGFHEHNQFLKYKKMVDLYKEYTCLNKQ